MRSWARSFIAARKLGRLGSGSTIGEGVRLRNSHFIRIGDDTRIDDGVYLNGLGKNGLDIGDRCQIRFGTVIDCWKGVGIKIGNDTFIGPLSVIQGQGGTVIGDGCLIGGHAYIVPSSHVFDDRSIPIRLQGETTEGVEIQDDVWIGSGVAVLDGVNIGKGSVIGAGSVVTRSIPSYSVAYGVPARIQSKR
jgi:acetyltransferase-like isoleucine patch superfamily enzyme